MRRGEHLLPRVEKERCATQGRHPSFAPFVCHSPHGKRRRTTSSAVLAGPFEPKDYGALPPCDGTQASRGALAFGPHWQRRHRTVRDRHEISVSSYATIRTNCIVPFSVERVGTNIYLCDLLF